ncbi:MULTISPECIES: hypothetical protein [unclassified Streptomyces]|uniref:hypothetical protein n=1 Tax=unclassified Streptomyces TaxID=2593676 RepID=UPI003870C28B
MVESLLAELKHECELIMAEENMVMVRGRFSGHGQPAPWIAVDFLRIEDGILMEHWDVIQDEALETLPERIPERPADVRRRLPRGAPRSAAGVHAAAAGPEPVAGRRPPRTPPTTSTPMS